MRTFVIAAALVLFGASASFACESMKTATGKQSKVVAEEQTPLPIKLPSGQTKG
ncbi:MAG: hypothetical protein R3C97_13290 [Geminicoccaceae bacterium]